MSLGAKFLRSCALKSKEQLGLHPLEPGLRVARGQLVRSGRQERGCRKRRGGRSWGWGETGSGSSCLPTKAQPYYLAAPPCACGSLSSSPASPSWTLQSRCSKTQVSSVHRGPVYPGVGIPSEAIMVGENLRVGENQLHSAQVSLCYARVLSSGDLGGCPECRCSLSPTILFSSLK